MIWGRTEGSVSFLGTTVVSRICMRMTVYIEIALLFPWRFRVISSVWLAPPFRQGWKLGRIPHSGAKGVLKGIEGEAPTSTGYVNNWRDTLIRRSVWLLKITIIWFTIFKIELIFLY